MKRFLLLILTLALVFALVLSVSSCDVLGGKSQNEDSANTPGDNETPDNSAHTHSYTVKNTDAKYLKSAASCSKSAEYFYSCECGEKSTNTFTHGNFASHNYEGGKCTVCDASDPNYINPNAPVAGKTYHLGLVNTNVDTDVHYICGGMVATYYLATSTDESAALDVYVEKITDGYYIYTLSGSDKNYINFIVDGSYVNAKYQPTPSTVFTYSDSLDTLTAVVNGEDYLLGVPNTSTYVNAGPYKASTNPFPCTFYEVSEGGNTENPPHTHNFVNGECTVCGADDPDYIPPHTHNFVDGECTVCGADYYSEGLAYKLSSDGNYYTVTGIGSFTGSNLVIPNQYEGIPVEVIGANAFDRQSAITSVTIPESIKEIKEYAFAKCSNIEKIYYNAKDAKVLYASAISMWLNSGKDTGIDLIIGGKVSVVPDNVFSDLTNLKSVKFEENTNSTTIYGAFGGCTGIVDVYIPSIEWWCSVNLVNRFANPMYFAQNVYVGENLLTELTFPNGISEIPKNAFINCPAENVIIPEGVTSIGAYAFYNAKTKSFTMPESLEVINEYAFEYCTELESITIPKNVYQIYKSAFSYCTSVKTVYYNAESLLGSGAENNLIDVSQNNRFENLGADTDGVELIIGKSVKIIPEYLFNNYPGNNTNVELKLVKISFEDGSTCEEIKQKAFLYCTYLTSLELPSSLRICETAAFEGCTALRDVHAESLEAWLNIEFEYYDTMFTYAENLYVGGELLEGELTIPSSITKIGAGAFSGYKKITSLTLESHVEYVDVNAFKDCTGLLRIVSSAQDANISAFSGCSSVNTVIVRAGAERTLKSICSGCSSMKTLYVPASILRGDFGSIANLKDLYYAGTEAEFKANDLDELNGDFTTHYNSVF